MYRTLDLFISKMRGLVGSIYSGMDGIYLTLEFLGLNLVQHGVEHNPPEVRC